MIRSLDAWVIRRMLAGGEINGERESLSDPFLRIAEHLDELDPQGRQAAWNGFLCGRADADELTVALSAVDPLGPPPEPEPARSCATLADVRSLVASAGWHWEQWLLAGALNGLAADPGTGKTVMAADLARRLWFGEPWPDGQPNTFPEGTRTLWVPGDRHYSQLMDLAASYKLPDEALLFNASPDDPTTGFDLDDPAELTKLADRIVSEKPGLVIVDTVGMSTGRNLCKPEDANAYFGPLMDIAQATGRAFLLLTHLSSSGEALGRRFTGACRVVWKMTTPDPEKQPDRRRVWVDKSLTVKPAPLGMTFGDEGCTFDFTPPTGPEPRSRKRGPSPEKLEACKTWLAERLTTPSMVVDVRRDAEAENFSAGTLYGARDALSADEYTLDGRKWWKLPTPSEAADHGDDAAS
ncbi:AAA family ATPase [Tautonia sp. JC769]|uniref:AAA family ATPase n=1 Tax=Tautonia sp. JC769 TaxID=3232135 RepID=UPI00345AE44D